MKKCSSCSSSSSASDTGSPRTSFTTDKRLAISSSTSQISPSAVSARSRRSLELFVTHRRKKGFSAKNDFTLRVRLHYQFSGMSNIVRTLRFLIRLVIQFRSLSQNLPSNIVRILALNHMHGQLFSICHSTDVALRSKRLRLLVLKHTSWRIC